MDEDEEIKEDDRKGGRSQRRTIAKEDDSDISGLEE